MDWLLRKLIGNFGGIEPRSIATQFPPRRVDGRGISEL